MKHGYLVKKKAATATVQATLPNLPAKPVQVPTMIMPITTTATAVMTTATAVMTTATKDKPRFRIPKLAKPVDSVIQVLDQPFLRLLSVHTSALFTYEHPAQAKVNMRSSTATSSVQSSIQCRAESC